MKVLQLAALFGAVVSAAKHRVVRNGDRRDIADTATAVVFVTSMLTYTTLCTHGPDCPPSTTIMLTSTTLMSTTTTICSTPGAVLPPYGASSPPVSSSALPIAPGSPIATSGPSVGTGGIPSSPVATSFAIQPSLPGFSLSIITASTVESFVSIVPPSPSGSGYAPPLFPSASMPSGPISSGPTSSGPVSSTLATGSTSDTGVTSYSDSVPSNPFSSTAVPSNTNTDAIHTSFPTASSSGGYNVPSEGSGIPSSTGTDAAHTSHASSAGPSSVGLPSFNGSPSAGPTSPVGLPPYMTATFAGSSSVGPGSITTPIRGPSDSASGNPSGTAPGTTDSATHPTSEGHGPSTPPAVSDSTVDSTVRVTSYLTRTITSIITTPPAVTVPSNITNSNIEATDISRASSVSGLPSGSGYAHPSGSLNGSVISPRPTYSEVPINMGHIVGAGKSSLVAIVVALAFAHFA